MVKIGQRNQLKVVDIYPMGYALNDAQNSLEDPIILKETTESYELGDEVDVFVYTQADGSLLASTQQAKVHLQHFAALTVVGTVAHGCFFDWGITPDLYAPEGQLHGELDIGSTYVVRLVTDKLGKLVATTKIERFLESDARALKPKQSVELLIYAQTPLGFKAAVNNRYQGLLYKSDLIKKVRVGDKINGFVKHIRDDGKLDLSLQVQGAQARKSLSQDILDDLAAHDGMSTLTDKSSPDEIFARFKVSKGAYKKALGNLYRDKKIRIEKQCVYLQDA